jgi:hypothetical protein
MLAHALRLCSRKQGARDGGGGRDDSTKEFKKAAKAMGNKRSKKEEKTIEKITKHLSKNEKL